VNGWVVPSAEAFARGVLAAGLFVAGTAWAAASSRDSSDVAGPGAPPIRAVHLRIGEVFDPVPPGVLSPFYRLANRLHVRSRERTVRAHLVIEPGQRFSERRLQQQERVLRSLDFLQPESVSVSIANDSADVWIRTRDVWTTQPEMNLERGGGRQFGTFGIAERNLFGLGKALAINYSEDPTGISRRIAFDDPAVLDTRVRFRWSAADGTSGASDLFSLWQPFLTEDDVRTWGIRWDRSGSVARLFEGGEEKAAFDRDVNDFEMWYGMGARDDGIVRRLTFSYRVLDREFGPSIPAAGSPPEFSGPATSDRFRRLAVETRLWHPHFLERHGVDQPDRIEDVDIGPSVAVMAGVSPRSFGSSADEGFLQARADFGTTTRFGVGTVRSVLATRLRRRALEMVRSADVRWAKQTGDRHTLVFAAYGAAGSNVPRDFQIVLGGLNGLRAYPVHALAGREVIRLNAEQRTIVARDVASLFSVGVAGFWDAARAWGPGAEGTVWFHDVGAGLRFAPPASTFGNVLRVDVAWPISPTRDGQREPVFSFGSTQAF
jgi:hypothetical protein